MSIKYLKDLKIKIFNTQDGSLGLFSEELNEIYHSKFGAKKEAFEKFVEPALFLNSTPVDILDICYGIGYNTKTALLNFQNIKSIDCLEKEKLLVENSYKFDFNVKINSIIKSNLEKEDFIRFHIDDARVSIQKLNKKYDLIFHDGFCPAKQAILWSEDFILKVSELMKEDALFCTYNHSKPVLSALYKAGLFIGKTIKENRVIGTIASKNKNLIKNPLNDFEISELKTKSAITYKDRGFTLTHEEIMKNRENEIEKSKLITLSKLKSDFKFAKIL